MFAIQRQTLSVSRLARRPGRMTAFLLPSQGEKGRCGFHPFSIALSFT